MDHTSTLIAGGGVALLLFCVVLGLATTVFWIVALVDAIRRQFDSDTTKIIWVCVIFFLHFLGAIIYWFGGRPTGRLSGSPY